MDKIKKFLIFKNDRYEEGSSKPTHRIAVEIGGKLVDIGAGWTKEGKKGKFISCKLNDEYRNGDHYQSGYAITEDAIFNSKEQAADNSNPFDL